ncbi:hypothetical protein Aperf_G00000077980 [Anoplocephala perfoliata]
MLSILGILSYTTVLIYGFALLFCIAIGLFYLTELVEEYTVATGKIIRSSIYVVVLIQFTFPFFDGLSFTLTAIGILAHISYLQLLSTFPAFRFSSFSFILDCVLFILHHIVAFTTASLFTKDSVYILTYFTFFVWLVPFMFLLSLSANDDILPQHVDFASYQETMPLLNGNNDLVSSFLKGKRRSLYSALTYLRDKLPEFRSKKLY